MTRFRVVNEVTTFLNDGSVVGDMPRREIAVLWEGDRYPDEESINVVTTDLRRVEQRNSFTGQVLWKGNSYPSFDDAMAIASKAPPASDFERRHYPFSNIQDVARAREVKIQRQRTIRWLGWKTLAEVGLDFSESDS